MISLSFDVGVKNLSCCSIELSDEKCKILDWSILSLIDSDQKVKGVSQNDISLAMFQQLDDLMERLGDINIDNVLIESQPCMKNPVMKSIQMILYSYFMLRKHQQGTVDSVSFVFAGTKNNAKFHTFELPEPPKANMKPYDLRKWQSVEYTKDYIKDNETLVSKFNSYKKKDDLADCFMQSVVWHKRNKLFVEAFDNVI